MTPLPLRVAFSLLVVLMALPACKGGKDETGSADSTEHIGWNTLPCQHPEYWPHQMASEQWPVMVHYREAADAGTAAEVLGYLETSWQVEMEELGFRRPLDDEGRCGPDGSFDGFLWRGLETCYADTIEDNPSTEWDDWFTYMVIDPWGPYGGDMLDSTTAHELNHASQAADDWWDSPTVFEMTSALIEEAVYDDDNTYRSYFADFQARPDWALDWNDDYETWYMYGASLYFYFLRDRYFDGAFSWAAEMWLNMRNPPGAMDDPLLNEPDFEDALEDLLQDRAGVSFFDSVTEFARWRWFVGSRDDGAHFEEGADYPEDALITPTPVTVGGGSVFANPQPMKLGNAYFELQGAPNALVQASLYQELQGARAVVQLLPGVEPGSDGETLEGERGPWPVVLDDSGTRILVVTLLPTGEDDPDSRTDERFAMEVEVW